MSDVKKPSPATRPLVGRYAEAARRKAEQEKSYVHHGTQETWDGREATAHDPPTFQRGSTQHAPPHFYPFVLYPLKK